MATGGAGGEPASTSFRLSAKDRYLHFAIATASNGLLLGQSPSVGGKPELVHFDSTGKPQWSQQLSAMDPEFQLRGGTRRTDDGYALAAEAQPNGGPGVVVTLSAAGQVAWSKTYAAISKFNQISQTSDGGYLVRGDTGFGPATKAAVVRLDAQGNVQWGASYLPPGNSHDLGSVATSDDGFVFLASLDPQTDAMAMLKLDSQGKLAFAKTVKVSPLLASAASTLALPGGGFIAALLSFDSSFDAVIVVVDSKGDVLTSQRYPGLGSPSMIVADSNSGYLIAGLDAGATAGFWWAKVDATGAFNTVRRTPEASPGFSTRPLGLAFKTDGSFLMASSHTENNDWWAIIDAMDPSGKPCPLSQTPSASKATLQTTTTDGGGSFSALSVSATTYPLTQSSFTPAFALVCGS